jgi:3-hydroxyisobutyrate dehydrogenase-like beta-hydroxyacid dehydrogenase
MGEFVLHVGPQGHGSTIKLINNSLGATNAAALAEALVFARKAGVDLDATLEIVSGGAGGSRALDLKARPMLEHDFDVAFKLEHSLKDVRHTLDEAGRLGVPLTLAQQAERLLAEAEIAGHGADDYAAVIVAAERAAGAQPRP